MDQSGLWIQTGCNGEVIGSILGQTVSKLKKREELHLFQRLIDNSIIKGNKGSKISAIHLYAQLELPNKDRKIKGLVVCNS